MRSATSRRIFIFLSPLALLFAACYSDPSQLPAVRELVARSRLVRIACLDANGDGHVDASDADPALVTDLTGDGMVDDADLELVRSAELALPAGKPPECGSGQPAPDWQVSPPAAVDCARGRGGLIVIGVGGGAVELRNPAAAAGARWMLGELGEELSDRDVPHQLISVAPGLNGTEQPQPDAERWAAAYLELQLRRAPCLRAVLLGHSHGGVLVTAVAARLEQAGLGDRVLLAVLIDRAAVLYAGDTQSVPQAIPVLNVYQTNDGMLRGAPIEQANVENWDASGEKGPANGDRGGRRKPVNHTTIDNSRAVLDAVTERVLLLSCASGLC